MAATGCRSTFRVNRVMSWTRPDAKWRSSAPGKFVKLTEGETHYQLYGEENVRNGKALIVCVHGISAECALWDTVVKEFAASGRTVLTFDLFGRGYSDSSEKHNDLNLFVDQLHELLACPDVTRVIPTDTIDLLGVSLGGGISAGYASKFSSQVRKLILMAPAGLSLPTIASWTRPVVRLPLISSAIAMIAKFGIQVGISRAFGTPCSDPDVASYIPKQQNRIDELVQYNPGYLTSFVSTIGWFPLDMMEAEFRSLNTRKDDSFLVIWGDQDHVVSYDQNITLIRRYCPKADFRILLGGGHIDQFIVAKYIRDLLAIVLPYLQ